jgi:hypothetical protein
MGGGNPGNNNIGFGKHGNNDVGSGSPATINQMGINFAGLLNSGQRRHRHRETTLRSHVRQLSMYSV